MIAFPAGAKVWIAGGVTDMRCGMNSLALKVQQGLGGETVTAVSGSQFVMARHRTSNSSFPLSLRCPCAERYRAHEDNICPS